MTTLLVVPLIFTVPFVLQGLAIMIDEFYFHHQRGLGAWERIGHPLDTLTVLAGYLFLIFNSYSEKNLYIFVGLSAFSCLFVTKDEFVHAELCRPSEHWLHAVLFVLHPLCFLSAALLWKNQMGDGVLRVQSLILTTFILYQIIYWRSRSWKKT